MCDRKLWPSEWWNRSQFHVTPDSMDSIRTNGKRIKNQHTRNGERRKERWRVKNAELTCSSIYFLSLHITHTTQKPMLRIAVNWPKRIPALHSSGFSFFFFFSLYYISLAFEITFTRLRWRFVWFVFIRNGQRYYTRTRARPNSNHKLIKFKLEKFASRRHNRRQQKKIFVVRLMWSRDLHELILIARESFAIQIDIYQLAVLWVLKLYSHATQLAFYGNMDGIVMRSQ